MKPTLLTILVALILLCSCAHYKPDPWTKNQVVLQGVAVGLKAVDWGQTLDVVDKSDTHYEKNPILGEYPTRAEVNRYFAYSMAGQLLITYLLPSKYRKYWLGLNIAISGYLVNHNYRLGLRVNF